MNVDSQDLVSKMEGFSVQGMQGGYYFKLNKCSAETIQVLRKTIKNVLRLFGAQFVMRSTRPFVSHLYLHWVLTKVYNLDF